jgi:hypothetical protein
MQQQASQGRQTEQTDRLANVIIPRSFRVVEAANYTGFAASFLNNLRCADMRAARLGKPVRGPRWITVGTAVRYLREDLDAWLDAHRMDPGQGDPLMAGELETA